MSDARGMVAEVVRPNGCRPFTRARLNVQQPLRRKPPSKPPLTDGHRGVAWNAALHGPEAVIVTHTDSLQRTVGNRTMGVLLTARRSSRASTISRAPQLPAAGAGSGVIGADPAAGLGQDYDASVHPVDVVSGGGTPSQGLPTAFMRLQGLWMSVVP